MMKLTTLWAIDRMVDPATGRSPLADAIAGHWHHDHGSVRFFRTSANAIYRLERDGRAAYLRIAPASERSREHIEREIDLIAWLTEQGIPVVQPIRARNGETVVSTTTSLGDMHAVLFDALDGRLLDLNDLNPHTCHTWGATVGRLHATLARAPDQLRGRRAGWHAALDEVASGEMPFPAAVQAEANRLQTVLADLPPNRATYGPIHTDLELDNLVWNNGDVAILDLDEFGDGWFMLDIAKAITGPLREGDTLESSRIADFIAGYREHHPLEDAMLAHLVDFLALSELRGYVSLVRAVDIAPDDAGEQWLHDLIVRIHAWMRRYEAGLAAARR